MRFLPLFLIFVFFVFVAPLSLSAHRVSVNVEIDIDGESEGSLTHGHQSIEDFVDSLPFPTLTEDNLSASAKSALDSQGGLTAESKTEAKNSFAQWMKKYASKEGLLDAAKSFENFVVNFFHLKSLHQKGFDWAVPDLSDWDDAGLSTQEFIKQKTGFIHTNHVEMTHPSHPQVKKPVHHIHHASGLDALDSQGNSTNTKNATEPAKAPTPVVIAPGKDALQAKFPAGFGATFDWRTHHPPVLSAVQNQGQCGSCTQFSTMAAVESAHAIAHGTLFKVSEEYPLDCTTGIQYGGVSGGRCAGSSPFITLSWLMGNADVGKVTNYNSLHADGPIPIYSEASYGYELGRGTCHKSGVDTGIRVTSYEIPHRQYSADPHTQLKYNAEALMESVSKGPTVVAINAECLRYYSDRVLDNNNDLYKKDGNIQYNHAVVVVGWATSTFKGGLFRKDKEFDYWIIRNSWGDRKTNYGGYYYLMRGSDICGIESTTNVVRPIVQ